MVLSICGSSSLSGGEIIYELIWQIAGSWLKVYTSARTIHVVLSSIVLQMFVALLCLHVCFARMRRKG